MKLFFSEFKENYEKYHFPYQVWLLRENIEETESIYEKGFLPIRNMENVFYLSRNVRVNLEFFEPSSENRRVLRKSEDLKMKDIPLSGFSYTPEVQKFCVDYGIQRFGKGLFISSAVREIFNSKMYNHIYVFTDKKTQKVLGYVVCFVSKNILQYAHSFYDASGVNENLGAGMMLLTILWAKQNNKKYTYLGTCYDQKSLYKTEFKGVEFFNGFRWSENLQELKELIGYEEEEQNYVLKRKDFLEKFYGGNLQKILTDYGIGIRI